MEDREKESKIEQILSDRLAALDQKLQKDITGAIGRVSRKYDNYKQEIEGNITQLLESSVLNNHQLSSSEKDRNKTVDESETIANLKQKLEEVEAERDRILSEAKTKDLENKFISATVGKIHNPRGFLRLLRDIDGIVLQEGDKLLVNTPEIGENGEPRKVEAVEYLDTLLQNEEYAHFAKSRPGAGTGSQLSPDSYSVGGERAKYFNSDFDSANFDSRQLVKDLKSGKVGDVIDELTRKFEFDGSGNKG